jgi:LPXTG-motif cell wall-anchored protein
MDDGSMAETPVTPLPAENAIRIGTADFNMALDTTDSGAKMEGSDIVLTHDTPIRVFGKGFKPGSEVEVWVFSTPTFLGTATVSADGTFSKFFTIPSSIEAGNHTLQAEGVNTADQPRAVSAGVIVRGEEMPETGSNPAPIAMIAGALLLAGFALLTSRRRLS